MAPDGMFNKQRGGPTSDKIVGVLFAVFLGLGLLFIIVDIVRSASDDQGTDTGCSTVYDQHLENAREFGYPPEDRSSFIDECERGRDELDG